MSRNVAANRLIAALVVVLGAVACGTTSSTSASSSISPATPVASAAPSYPPMSATCPTAAMVGSALGRTLNAPRRLDATGLQPGQTGFACDYLGSTSSSVLIDMGSGYVGPSRLSAVESAMSKAAAARGGTVTFTPVSGVGSKAELFNFSIPGVSEDGILADLGSSYVTITANPAATTAQLEALANQLL